MEKYTLVIQGRIFYTERPDGGGPAVCFNATSRLQREPGKKAGKTRYVTRTCYAVGGAWAIFWSKKNKAKMLTMTYEEKERYMDSMLEPGRSVIVQGKTLPELEGKKPGMLVTSCEVIRPKRVQEQEEYLHPVHGFGEVELEF